MKIRVVRDSEDESVIELTGVCVIREGETLDRISCGADDWFFDKDGNYDGHGVNLAVVRSPRGVSEIN
jgi:hypothetical protein